MTGAHVSSAHGDEKLPGRKRWRGLFVTGTDTDVGKTVMTAAIAAALRSEGRNVGVWKPVQSGGLLGKGITDAERLLRGTGIVERPEQVAPFTFAAPLAPALAAMQAGVSLTMAGLLAAGEPLAERYDALLIEGAGGAAVPLTSDALVVDLIAELGVPALIVARCGLGTVNHTLLTAGLLRQWGIPVAGVVMNEVDHATSRNDPSTAANAELIERYGGLRVLGRFPWVSGEATMERLVQAVKQHIDISPVRQLLENEINS
ncbi:ATP-dependent dethiobiotin synthetase BioD [Paenibacillus tyrfis]|uniref:dethiobiotin synthase n=1 Tax=Paenibacillus tyrfis TaxID=1501230 RepID=UPI00249147A5|nr:dethiobiotin synthase [Paenibacillus tyrfis]GLI08562.1 ATP-dependent dethiobiotin synthetase BioD [Paenibacillus tyrfis]